MNETVQNLLAGLIDALDPVIAAFEDPDELVLLLEDLGWNMDPDLVLDALYDVNGDWAQFAQIIADIRDTTASAQGVVEQMRSGAPVDMQAILALAQDFRDVFAALQQLKGPGKPVMPDILSLDDLWQSLIDDLPDMLIIEHIATALPGLHSGMEALGLIERRVATPQGTLRQPYTQYLIHWDRLGDILSDPVQHIREVYRWDGASKPGADPGAFDFARAAQALLGLAQTLRFPAAITPIDPEIVARHYDPLGVAEPYPVSQLFLPVAQGIEGGAHYRLALIVAPVPTAPDGVIDGLLVTQLAEGEASSTIALKDGWLLALAASADADFALELMMTPDGVDFATELPQPPSLSATLTRQAQADPDDPDLPPAWPLVGGRHETGLSLRGLSVGLGLGPADGRADVTLSLDVEGLTLTIKAGDGDSFINAILAAVDISASIDLGLAYSTRNGLSLVATGGSLGGPDGFTVDVPVSLNLGPFTLNAIKLNLAGIDNGFSLSGSSDLSAVIGPFAAEIADLGIAFDLVEAQSGSGLIGPFDIETGFRQPSRIAFSLATEAVRGGGFLERTETRYSGALMLEALSVGIAAITVIDTELPGDPDGWSFFAALTLTFPAVPLGFGFSLTGLGGLIALNREFDDIALASGLKTGAADALLFPDDPIGDAAAIISQIDTYFPPMQGNTVIGPLVQIGWGVPKPLITAELGVIISLPQGVIALLGSVSALLPTPEAPLLTLKMDVLGSIDVPEGTMMMLASLYDSKLLATIDLSGDMGMFLATRNQPYFLMSVGGYNPGFRPPALVPAPLQNLRRMQAKIELGGVVEVRITNYFAVTSNTIQFGSEVYMEAETKIGPVRFLAKGDLAFHIFLRFSPFLIKADFEASVGIYVGGKEVLSAYLTAHLEGPEPWYALGTAGFRFLGKEIEFEVEVGSKAPPENKPLVYLRDDVLAALADPASWREVLPLDQVAPAITYLDPEDDDGRLWVRPDCGVEVGQGAAPLHRAIDKVGQGLPAPGHDRIEIDTVRLAGQVVIHEDVQDWFAPAQFEDIGKAEKLTRASFEMMDAGAVLSRPELGVTPNLGLLGREVAVGYEEVLFEPETGPATIKLPEGSLELSAHMSGAGQALRRPARARGPGRFTLSESAYVVVDPLTGEVDTNALMSSGLGLSGGNQHAARQASGGALLAVPLSVGGGL